MIFFEQSYVYKTWSSESESTLPNPKNPILKEITMFFFFHGHQNKIDTPSKDWKWSGNFEITKKSEFRPR